ncbi:MAG: ATP-binding protein [Marinilabiliales bacterium]|nr:ATP-binding protein [Marinilabiliales bacterium]
MSLDKNLRGKYLRLSGQELLLVRLLFYVNLSLFLLSLLMVLLDFADYFPNSYLPHSLSFMGIFVLIGFFLMEGKKNSALNSLFFLPIPAYFLMISSRFAIFPPESSFNYEIYLYTVGLLVLLLLSDHPIRIGGYLLLTSVVLAGHIVATVQSDLIFRINWDHLNSFHPLMVYLAIGVSGILIYFLAKRRSDEKELVIHSMRESQSRLFHQSFEGILRIAVERDEHGEKVGYSVNYVNPAFEEFFEVRSSEVKGMPVHLLFQKLFRGEVDWQSLFDPAHRVRKEFVVPHTGKWFQVSSLPVERDTLICFFENITGIKSALNELAISKHRYKLLLETIPDIFFVIDKEGTYVDYVPKSDNGIDIKVNEIIGSTIFEVGFSQKMVTQVSKSIATVLAMDTIETIEYALEVVGKGSCFFEMRMVKLNSTSVMAISRDISKQKFAAQAIDEARKKAEEADLLKAAFLRNISHEVRTPLNSIVGFSNILINNEVSRSERLNFLQIIARNCQILQHVFTDTIKLSKIQSGSEKAEKQLYNVNGMINDLLTQFQYEKVQLEKDHLRLIPVKGMDHPKFSFVCDGNKIRDIMESLLDNAVKFTEEGEIEFGYQLSDPHTAEFFVRDSGIGIARDQMERIFDRFYQVDSRVKREYGGSGIGLSIAKDFASLLDTEIQVESSLGKGSRFSFSVRFDNATNHLRIVS